jgi:penicillin-binding protein 2
MRLFQDNTRQRRTISAVFAITFAISVLLTAFFQTQVLRGEQYYVRSEENRLRPIVIPAPRGTMYDRNGEIVATSIPGFSVVLIPGPEDMIRQTLEDLAPFLGLARQQIERMMAQRNRRPHDLVTVTEDATFSQVAALEERRTSFPNVLITERPKRHYPAGPAVGHLVGYVAEIDRRELEMEQYRERGYRQGRLIGKMGLERQYEFHLTGRDGARFVEVDAMGRVVDPRSTVGAVAPVPGTDLHLTIDIGLQRYLQEIFPDTMRGAIVLMAPSTGEILGMYSNPSYDPNDFVGGIPGSLWRALQEDVDKPLLHRATSALYPPGSTWKLATAAAALEKGIINRNTRMPLACGGGMFYAGRYARCWQARGHGSLDLVGAIMHSCNVYFYQVGIRLGWNDLVEAGVRMGFHERTGIDLPRGEERAGEFPTGVEWFRRRFGNAPTPSEVLSLAIGQGPNSQSVLKMAHFFSALAGNGNAPAPHLASMEREAAEQSEYAIRMEISPDNLRALWDGMAAVTDRGGTAYMSSLERWKLYGKTGTSQNPHGENHGWFTAFAGPRDGPPEVAIAIVIEHGEGGSRVAPIAAKAAQFYLDKVYGFPFETQPTLAERMQRPGFDWSGF